MPPDIARSHGTENQTSVRFVILQSVQKWVRSLVWEQMSVKMVLDASLLCHYEVLLDSS